MKNKSSFGWLLFIGAMIIVFLLGLLASSIMERRTEALYVNVPKADLPDHETRSSVWGKTYPREYETHRSTSDMSFVPPVMGAHGLDVLGEDPRQVILWAGYAFAKDYNFPRGHVYAIEDVRNTLRTGAPMTDNDGPQGASCWVCKSPDVPRMMDKMGIDNFFKAKWAALGSEIVNPIGCADCHDPKTMQLTITRPHLKEAYKELTGRDISTATHQEMRSLVCAQCHVEYYFDKTRVEGATFVKLPWKNGMSVEQAEKYYDDINFYDFINPISKTPVIKAQHPDYELWSMGIHGQRGVSCADCHMPYRTEGGQKFTNHKIQSPLNDISNTCQVCHRQDAKVLWNNVVDRQKVIQADTIKLEDELVHAHYEAKAAWDKGATEDEMKPVLLLIRHGQWRWDMIAASHGVGFHAPIEAARVLNGGLECAMEARRQLAVILAKHGQTEPVSIPDISTKEKAQEAIGLDIPKERAAKAEFLKTVVPRWLEKARQEGRLDEAYIPKT